MIKIRWNLNFRKQTNLHYNAFSLSMQAKDVMLKWTGDNFAIVIKHWTIKKFMKFNLQCQNNCYLLKIRSLTYICMPEAMFIHCSCINSVLSTEDSGLNWNVFVAECFSLFGWYVTYCKMLQDVFQLQISLSKIVESFSKTLCPCALPPMGC